MIALPVVPHWLRLHLPRRLAYPAAGLMLSVALVAGLLTLQGWVSGRAPTTSWILEEVRTQPFVYGYLLVATMLMMMFLGWVVGRKEDLLEALSVTDPLTGLANRRRIRDEFAAELNRAARYGVPLSLLVVDVDRLKEINDQYGHASGDQALRLIAESLRRTCRTNDLPARYGGDEFVVLAVNTTASEALALAQRVQATVRCSSAAWAAQRTKEPPPPRHTVSIGAADLDCIAVPTFDALHAAADRALYDAKTSGRDRAIAAARLPGKSIPTLTSLTS